VRPPSSPVLHMLGVCFAPRVLTGARHAQGQVAVAAVLGKARLCEVERDERDVRVVHRNDMVTLRADDSLDVLALLFEAKRADRVGEYEMKL
jgi:hypothetical protein